MAEEEAAACRTRATYVVKGRMRGAQITANGGKCNALWQGEGERLLHLPVVSVGQRRPRRDRVAETSRTPVALRQRARQHDGTYICGGRCPNR
ncbi:hypothetical protein SCOCK_10010 [Actinacidiphila cocklensis]|uniref:Uncharacterized protein n=1 Tax=Actinacidiphila cocklensis TaxID=887465 RepID=A0A9W4DI34_9ACTN|nr:hypothetical protein SCOCK_10010 [Actinacidiphila cocklensis]